MSRIRQIQDQLDALARRIFDLETQALNAEARMAALAELGRRHVLLAKALGMDYEPGGGRYIKAKGP